MHVWRQLLTMLRAFVTVAPQLRRALRCRPLSAMAAAPREQLLQLLAARKHVPVEKESVLEAVDSLAERDLILNESDWVTAVSALSRVRVHGRPVTLLRQMQARGWTASE